MSLIELVEGMTIQAQEPLPEDKPNNFAFGFDIVTFWKRDKGEDDRKIDVKIDIIDPKGATLNSFDANFSFPSDKLNMRFVVKIFGFAVTIAGIYKLRLTCKEQSETEYKPVDEIPYTITLNVLQK